jgi:hypothetical protein
VTLPLDVKFVLDSEAYQPLVDGTRPDRSAVAVVVAWHWRVGADAPNDRAADVKFVLDFRKYQPPVDGRRRRSILLSPS